MMARTPLLLLLLGLVAGAAGDSAYLRREPDQMLHVLSRVDDLLDMEMDVLARETKEGVSAPDSNHLMARNARLRMA